MALFRSCAALRVNSFPAALRVVCKPMQVHFSTQKTTDADIVKSVLISQSTDIFTNLALEDWLYKNFNFTNQHVLLLWRNEPCVVIGRHQNAWIEANLPYLAETGIPLARRNSGGGTVFHDRGNLNLSFFTTKEHYDRKYNLDLIVRALFREFGVNASINERQDVVVKDKYKISGTAAKLGRPSAYHHCTLLVNSNKISLSKALAKHESGIKSNATQSVRSPICNLSEENPRITVDGLQTAIGWEFLRTPAFKMADGGPELISKQRGFQFVNPNDNWFPGINKIREEFASWEWRFGRTPDFSISRSFTVPVSLLTSTNSMDQFVLKEQDNQKLRIDMAVEKGLISDVTLNIPPGLMPSGFHGNASVVTHLKGKKFTPESLAFLQDALQTLHLDGETSPIKEREVGKLTEREQFVAKCFDQVMNTV